MKRTMFVDGLTVYGNPRALVSALREMMWQSPRTLIGFRCGVAERADGLHGQRIRTATNRGFLEDLAEMGEIELR